jgi:hypothetical protein
MATRPELLKPGETELECPCCGRQHIFDISTDLEEATKESGLRMARLEDALRSRCVVMDYGPGTQWLHCVLCGMRTEISGAFTKLDAKHQASCLLAKAVPR